MTFELFISGAAGQIENSLGGLCQTTKIEKKNTFSILFFVGFFYTDQFYYHGQVAFSSFSRTD